MLWPPVRGAPPAAAAAAGGLLAFDRTVPQLVVPDLASNPFQATGISDTYQGWTQIIASLGYNFLCMGANFYAITLVPPGNPTIVTTRVQVGVGAAASEVVKAAAAIRVGGTNPPPNSANIGLISNRELPFQPFVIPSGSRVAFRSTVDITTRSYLGLYLYGFDNDLFPESPDAIDHDDWWGGDLAATQGTVITPDGAGLTLTADAVAWTYGSWVEFIASAASGLLLRGITSGNITTWREAILQIGIGAAGSEVGYDRVGVPGAFLFNAPAPGYFRLARPFRVDSGERVALRMACDLGSYQMTAILAYEALV